MPQPTTEPMSQLDISSGPAETTMVEEHESEQEDGKYRGYDDFGAGNNDHLELLSDDTVSVVTGSDTDSDFESENEPDFEPNCEPATNAGSTTTTQSESARSESAVAGAQTEAVDMYVSRLGIGCAIINESINKEVFELEAMLETAKKERDEVLKKSKDMRAALMPFRGWASVD